MEAIHEHLMAMSSRCDGLEARLVSFDSVINQVSERLTVLASLQGTSHENTKQELFVMSAEVGVLQQKLKDAEANFNNTLSGFGKKLDDKFEEIGQSDRQMKSDFEKRTGDLIAELNAFAEEKGKETSTLVQHLKEKFAQLEGSFSGFHDFNFAAVQSMVTRLAEELPQQNLEIRSRIEAIERRGAGYFPSPSHTSLDAKVIRDITQLCEKWAGLTGKGTENLVTLDTGYPGCKQYWKDRT